MAELTRLQLQELAETTNIIDNNSQEIEPIEVRSQYENERDSTINKLDDGVQTSNTLTGQALTMLNPSDTVDLGVNDLTTKTNVSDLITESGGESNTLEVTNGIYLIPDEDNGKGLYHNLASAVITIPFGSSLEIFRVTCKETSQTTINGIGITLQDSFGNVISSWSNLGSSLHNAVVIVSKVDVNVYRVIEVKESLDVNYPVSFSVSSDATVSDDLTFNDVITIDLSSEITHPKLSSVSYEASEDGLIYVTLADLTALQSWIIINGSGIDYVIRAIGDFGTNFGSATIGFSFN